MTETEYSAENGDTFGYEEAGFEDFAEMDTTEHTESQPTLVKSRHAGELIKGTEIQR